MVEILTLSVKVTTPGIFKVAKFLNKSYDVIIFAYGVTNKILLLNSNYMVDVIMWPKFFNSGISKREVIKASILKEFDQKNIFWRGRLSSNPWI